MANADFATAAGQGATASAIDTTAVGTDATATAARATSYGSLANATGVDSTALGFDANATGPGDIAIGARANVLSDNSTATGTNTLINAGSPNSSTYGANTVIGANSPNSMALGANTAVGEEAPGAVAIGTDSEGVGATASLPNQMVLGTKNHTYTTPGITSGLSQSRQSGPLEVVTTDKAGNLASDNGDIFRRLNSLGGDANRARAGVALAMATAGPDLTGNERFGVSANWGTFDGENAFGMGFEGVVAVDLLTSGDRFAVTGGFGVGFHVDNGNNNFRPPFRQ